MEFLPGDIIPPQTGVVPFANNLTSFPKISTEVSHPQEINPSSNPELLHGNCDFSHFSNSDQNVNQSLLSFDLQFLAQLACQDNYELFNINKFVDHDNGCGGSANDNGSPGLLQNGKRKRKNAYSEYRDMASLASFLEDDLRYKLFSSFNQRNNFINSLACP